MNISRTHTYDIFLSYRRSDGKLLARLLKESLEKQGLRVFRDMDELVDGVFNERVLQAVESAPIFLLLMTPHVCYRCSQEKDWVRMEIECAIRSKRTIIPVNPDNRFKRFASSLPVNLQEMLTVHQYSVIDTGQLYQESVAKLIRERIRPIIKHKRLKKYIKWLPLTF
jgi:hypothetical protein